MAYKASRKVLGFMGSGLRILGLKVSKHLGTRANLPYTFHELFLGGPFDPWNAKHLDSVP